MLKNNQNGWTLLELLLAVALLALVAVIVYGSFRATIGAIEQSAAHGAPAREARVMLARLADELTAADWSEEREGTLFIGISDEIDGRPADRLQFTSRSHVWYPTQPPAVEQATIGYLPDRAQAAAVGAPGRASRPTLRLWREEQANPFVVSGGVERLLIAEELLGMELQFYADGAWTEAWDASASHRLPELVEVVLTFGGAGGREEEYRTMIALPPQES